MNTSVQKYEFELFLEGIKVPFQAVNISQSSEGISASIALPIDSNIRKVLPNTLVHLFFRRINENWRLLFDGYVTGKSESITNASASLSLQCRDISTNLDLMWKFYSSNQNLGDLQPKILRHFGAPNDPKFLEVRTAAESKRQQNITRSNSVMNLVINLIEEMLTWKEGEKTVANNFLQGLYWDAKFLDRFFYEEDDRVDTILKTDTWKTMLSRSPIQALQSMRTVINIYLSKTYYTTSYIASPIYKNNLLRQIIFKPDNFMIPAPLCNVVFPNMISGFETSRNFQSEPTRLMMRSDGFFGLDDKTNDLWQYIAYAPYEIKNLVTEGASNILHYGLINDEIYRGIIPTVTETDSSIRLLGAKIDKNSKESSEYFASMKYAAEYLLQQKQYYSRSFNSGECIFNPNMVVNYPAVVIKDPLIILGNVVSINHSINAGGRINTSFSMSHCRISDLKISAEDLKMINNRYKTTTFDWSSNIMTDDQHAKAELLGEDTFAYPVWLNENYLPAGIDTTYLNTLGCKSIMSVSPYKNSTAKIENVRSLYNMYKVYEQKDAGNIFSDKTTYRSIVTKDDFFEKFLGLEKTNSEQYSINTVIPSRASSLLKPTHQEIILAYKKNISKGVIKF